MERVLRIDHEQLESWAALKPQDRLHQAAAAVRLFLALHNPYSRPYARGFDSLEEHFEFEREQDLRI